MKTSITKKVITAISLLATLGLGASLPAVAKPGPSVTIKDDPGCSKPAKGKVACLSIRRTRSVNGVRGTVRPLATVQPMGGVAYGANQIRSAYSVTQRGARYKVIAVVIAYHSESAYQDLLDYRAMYNLGPMQNCTNPAEPGMVGTVIRAVPAGDKPCFMQLDQTGAAVGFHETDNDGWAQEAALDLQMATAICPNCSLALVEAKTASLTDLNLAVGAASEIKNVRSISNSYGGSDNGEFKYPAYAAAAGKGIAVVASSGDSGYGSSAPASFASVVAVGGTSLRIDAGGNYASESAWNKGGSGCSTYNKASSWQPVYLTGCAGKFSADVAAVADPATGVAVSYGGQWYTLGGTSVSAPIIAGMYAIGPKFGASAGEFTLANANLLHDITIGSNGPCDVKYWCNARTGWDGPTGLGTPNGAGAF